MGLYTFSQTKTVGISFIVPKNEINLDDEIQYYDNNFNKLARVKSMIGIDKRRVASENVTAADMCQQAAENMFSDMNIDPKSIDTLIFVSQSPDHAFPATACILQDKLGLPKNCAAFDVNQGCTAYTYGLWLASTMIDSGACKRVLVLVGESRAKYADPANRIVAPVFGDSGSATLLEYSEKEVKSYYAIGTDGSGAEAISIPVGYARYPLIEKNKDTKDISSLLEAVYDENNNPWYLWYTYMDGGAIFNFTLAVVPPHILELLSYAKFTHEEVDYLVLHQANKQIVQSIAKKTAFALEKVPHETFSKYGNLAGASIPSVICDQLVDTVSKEKTKVLLAGFGVGLSWASAILDLDNIYCSGMREYIEDANKMNKIDYIAYWKEKFKNTGKIKE